MSKIKNVGILDVRDIKEVLAKDITEIANVGMFIESDESQIFLKNCEKVNIGSTIRIPKDIKVITQNENVILDKDYLEGFLEPVVILINGSLIIKKDVDAKLINEKIYAIVVNGELVCTKKLAGVIQSKGTINGGMFRYNNDYEFIDGNINFTNRFLKGLKPNSKLAFKKLFIVEEVNKNLLEEKIADIQVLDKLIIASEYEKGISELICDYYEVDKVIVPMMAKTAKYIDDNIHIDESSIKKYDHSFIYVNGEVEISLNEDIEFDQYIQYLICDTVICNEKTYNMIKDSLSEDVNVEIINGRLLKNLGKIVLSGELEEDVTIKNMGKLIFEEDFNYDKLKSIVNYGIIEVPEGKMDIVKIKLKQNYGKIKIAGEKQVEASNDEKTLYENVAELKL